MSNLKSIVQETSRTNQSIYKTLEQAIKQELREEKPTGEVVVKFGRNKPVIDVITCDGDEALHVSEFILQEDDSFIIKSIEGYISDEHFDTEIGFENLSAIAEAIAERNSSSKK
jgi:hypothetical protein